MGGVKKKVGRRRKRTVGRPAKGYTIDGALIRKGFAQVQHESVRQGHRAGVLAGEVSALASAGVYAGEVVPAPPR